MDENNDILSEIYFHIYKKSESLDIYFQNYCNLLLI